MYVVAKRFNGQAISILDKEGKVALTSTLHNGGQGNLAFEDYVQLEDVQRRYPGGVELVSEEDFARMQDEWLKEQYTSKPPREVSEDHYYHMRGVVMPLKVGSGAHGDHWFICGEIITASIATMHAHRGDKYLAKEVDINDKSTWIRTEDFT